MIIFDALEMDVLMVSGKFSEMEVKKIKID